MAGSREQPVEEPSDPDELALLLVQQFLKERGFDQGKNKTFPAFILLVVLV
jgi:hypothetical protein